LFVDIANYLAIGKLQPQLSAKEKHKVVKTNAPYSWIIDGKLYKTSIYMIIRRCVREYEVPTILKACHDEPCGGNFADKRT